MENRTADPSPILIDELPEEPSDIEILGLPGEIVYTAAERPGEVQEFGDLFRFARVLCVQQRADWPSTSAHCARCGEERVRYRIEVEWEAGYCELPGEDVLCELCLFGVVAEGHEAIPFGDAEWPPWPTRILFMFAKTSAKEGE